MPPEIGYRRQIAPRPAAALPRTSARAFGAELADEMGRTAEIAHRERLEDHAIARRAEQDRQWTQFQHGFALARENMGGISRKSRDDGADGHIERVAETWEVHRENLLGQLSDENVRNRASAALETWGASFRDNEAAWQQVTFSKRAVEDYAAARDVAANRARRLESPDDYLAETAIQHDAIDALNIPEDGKNGLRRETDQVMAIAFLQGRIDADPVLAKAMIDQGAFDDVLDPKQVDALLRGIDVEIRKLDIAERRKADAEERALKEDFRVFKEHEEQGRDVTDQIAGLHERAAALGLDDVVAELEGFAGDAQFAKTYEGVPPAQLEQRMAVLRAKKDPSDLQAMELRWIEKHLPKVAKRYTEDPVNFYANESGPLAPPPIDFNDPASIDARAKWARSVGSPKPFSKVEAAELAQLYDSGRAGTVEVMEMLHRMPADQAMSAAKMIDPTDDELPVMVTLPKQYRDMARRGREALKANKKLLSDPMRDDSELRKGITALNGYFEDALRGVQGDQRQAIKNTALRIAAGYVDRDGTTITKNLYFHALNMALGARGSGADRRGGLGRWKDDNWYLLPSGVTGDEFARSAFAQARNNKVKPVNPDGSPAALKDLIPFAVGDGLYQFRSRSDGPVFGSDGKTWQIRVSR